MGMDHDRQTPEAGPCAAGACPCRDAGGPDPPLIARLRSLGDRQARDAIYAMLARRGVAAPADRAGATLSRPALAYKDTTNEAWREYRYSDAQGVARVYRIDDPVRMYYYKGCTTHRVLDARGLVHVVPAISQGGCVMVYKPRDVASPCAG